MITRILIPATVVQQRFIRVWTCYDHQITRTSVDTEQFFEDISIPEKSGLSHKEIVELMRVWKGNLSQKILLAYRVVGIEFICDDRSALGHKNSTTQRDVVFHGPKVVVYTSRFGCPKVTMLVLAEDAECARTLTHISDLSPRNKRHARDRRIITDTADAFDELCRQGLSSDQELLKLGPATYVVLTEEIEYRPVEGLNEEPES
jgi:hypothetical protein